MVKRKDVYEVGYGKPPKEHRFEPGISGNYLGRPTKETKSVGGLRPSIDESNPILREAARKIRVRDGHGQKEITVGEGVLRAQATIGMRGNATALRDFSRSAERAANEKRKLKLQAFEAMLEYKEFFTAELKKLRELGRPLPDLPFKPDEIFFDQDCGVHIISPATEEDRTYSAMVNKHYAKRKEALKRLKTELLTAPPHIKPRIAKNMQKARKFIKFVEDNMKDTYPDLADFS